MSEFETAERLVTAPSKSEIIGAVIREIYNRDQNISFESLGDAIGLTRREIQQIIFNKVGPYRDPNYVSPRNDAATETMGWQINQVTWKFCHYLYKFYGVTLEYGEYTAIRRQIQSGEAEVVDNAYPVVYGVTLPRHMHQRIFVTATPYGLPSRVLQSDSYQLTNEGWKKGSPQRYTMSHPREWDLPRQHLKI